MLCRNPKPCLMAASDTCPSSKQLRPAYSLSPETLMSLVVFGIINFSQCPLTQLLEAKYNALEESNFLHSIKGQGI